MLANPIQLLPLIHIIFRTYQRKYSPLVRLMGGVIYCLSSLLVLMLATAHSFMQIIPTVAICMFVISSVGVFRAWAALLSDMNTVKDTNGFIKAASPVVKLFADGSAETNEESQGVTVTRLVVGNTLLKAVWA